MDAQMVGGISLVVVAGGLFFRDRHLKAKFRGCRCCGRTHVARTFKMYPIVGSPGVAQVLVSLFDGPPLITTIAIKDGRAAFTVYKFCDCKHCGHFAMVESYDKWFTLPSLRHKAHSEPQVFTHDPCLFERANLAPCKTLNFNFHPSVLGEATIEEKLWGFRCPFREVATTPSSS
ncbi:MAG: hypothetical protein AAB447_00785 [Patescibacteria group bacterium]